MCVLDLVEGRVMEIERTFFEERVFSHRWRAGGRRLFRGICGTDKERQQDKRGEAGANEMKRADGEEVFRGKHNR